MQTDSKDTIRSRMIRNASGIWGYTDTQDINSFDPVVGMIIGALAEELYILSGEIKKSDSRIVEKLLELLFNQSILTHFPAHAIARANPSQAHTTVSEFYQFYNIKKIPKTVDEVTVYENKSIFFTPSASFKLYKGEVKYFAGGKYLFEISGQNKETLGLAHEGSVTDNSRLFIGLKIDKQVDKLDGLGLMFGVRNIQNEERFYNSLSSARWKLNGKEINVTQGFQSGQTEQVSPLTDIIRKGSDISYKLCSYVNEFYNRKFMVVEKRNYRTGNFPSSELLPDEIKNKFPSLAIKNIPKDIHWFEIILSQPVEQEVLGDLAVSMNCFPVINRQMNEFSQILTRGVNVIPLKTDDMFFDVVKISDTKNNLYRSLSSFPAESEDDGYMIRQGGIARFDSRDAKETINHLVDLIRDERSRFAILGTDLITSELRQLDQIVSRLKQRLENTNVSGDSSSYVLLNSKSNYERATVQFWSTSGEQANNIRASSKLYLQHGTDLDPDSILLCTNTSGGKQKLSGEDKINKLRRAILSKGRVVTKEDIKALCFEQFGPELISVEIKNGVEIANAGNKGLSKTLDIYLSLVQNHKLTDDDLNQMIEGLKIRLKQESINLLPYRVFIKGN